MALLRITLGCAGHGHVNGFEVGDMAMASKGDMAMANAPKGDMAVASAHDWTFDCSLTGMRPNWLVA